MRLVCHQITFLQTESNRGGFGTDLINGRVISSSIESSWLKPLEFSILRFVNLVVNRWISLVHHLSLLPNYLVDVVVLCTSIFDSFTEDFFDFHSFLFALLSPPTLVPFVFPFRISPFRLLRLRSASMFL